MDQLCYNVFLQRYRTISDVHLLPNHWSLTQNPSQLYWASARLIKIRSRSRSTTVGTRRSHPSLWVTHITLKFFKPCSRTIAPSISVCSGIYYINPAYWHITPRIHPGQSTGQHPVVKGVPDAIRLDLRRMLSWRLCLGQSIQDSQVRGVPTSRSLETAWERWPDSSYLEPVLWPFQWWWDVFQNNRNQEAKGSPLILCIL